MPAAPRITTPALAVITLLVLLVHSLALTVLARVLRPPSLLRDMAPPLYTRMLAPEAPAAAPAPAAVAAVQKSARKRASAHIRQRKIAINSEAIDTPAAPQVDAAEPPPQALADAALPPEPAASAALTAQAPVAAEPAMPASAAASAAAPAAPAGATALAAPAEAASAAAPAFLADWPGDTRLDYALSGNYRGELHGSAQVLWQREGTRYHTAVVMNAGLLASLSFSSQGEITAAGLRPEVYEEDVRGRRRGVRLGEEVRLNNGERLPRPEQVQDTASQFVELSHRFASGQARLAAGEQIRFALARPGGIDQWTYDVVGEETLHLPRLGPVRTLHLKPRPLDKPRGPISAEIWYAPALQYLPVRIRINAGQDAYLDLLVNTVEQR